MGDGELAPLTTIDDYKKESLDRLIALCEEHAVQAAVMPLLCTSPYLREVWEEVAKHAPNNAKVMIEASWKAVGSQLSVVEENVKPYTRGLAVMLYTNMSAGLRLVMLAD